MLNATAYEFGWRTVVLALASRNRDLRLANETTPGDMAPDATAADTLTDDAEAFMLDDTEMADRLSPSRARPTYTSTPPHAHLTFPMLGRLVR